MEKITIRTYEDLSLEIARLHAAKEEQEAALLEKFKLIKEDLSIGNIIHKFSHQVSTDKQTAGYLWKIGRQIGLNFLVNKLDRNPKKASSLVMSLLAILFVENIGNEKIVHWLSQFKEFIHDKFTKTSE